MKVQLIYLGHSGFALLQGKEALVFDYYTDHSDTVRRLSAEGYTLSFFVSHSHGDHFNPDIFAYRDAQFIVENSVHCERKATAAGVDKSQIFRVRVGETKRLDSKGWTIRCFPSTDAGGAFYVDTGLGRYYHSGDLNWWHWLGDTEENKAEADALKDKCYATLPGLSCDIAMFPVDARLEGAREWGLIEFLRIVKVAGPLVSMHHNGPVWTPSAYVKALFPHQEFWAPEEEGDGYTVDLDGLGS